MKSKILQKVSASIFCTCLCLASGVTLFACGKSEPKLEKIEVNTQGATVSYITGENFTTNGLVVTATYSDKKTKSVTDYTAKAKHENTMVNVGEQFTIAGAYTVTVTYGQKAANYNIQVSQPSAEVELTTDFESKVKATTSYLSNELYNKSSTLSKDLYSVEDLKKEDVSLKYYDEVATLKNFDDVTSITLGEQVFNKNDKVSVSIGHNKFIQDKVWYVDAENKLFVASAILNAELSLNKTFKVNNIEVTHGLALAIEGELTSITTEEPNKVDSFDPEISDIIVGNPSIPFYFNFSDTESDYVFTKLISEYNVNGDTVDYVQYGVSTVDGPGKFGLIIEWGKTAEEIYEQLNDTVWTYSIFVNSNDDSAATVYTTDLCITVKAESQEPELTETDHFMTGLYGAIENLNNVVYRNSASLTSQKYSFDQLKQHGTQFSNAQFYVAAGKLVNFPTEIENVTIGAATYGKNDKVLVSIGHNHFIEDFAWKVTGDGENRTLYIAAPVAKVEFALDEENTFKVDGTDVWTDAIPLDVENFTNVRTAAPNGASKTADGWNLTLKDTTTPFFFEFGAEEPVNIVSKTVKHLPDGSSQMQYGITPLESDHSYGCYFCYGNSIDDIYDVLNNQNWEVSIITNNEDSELDLAYSAKLHFALEKQN